MKSILLGFALLCVSLLQAQEAAAPLQPVTWKQELRLMEGATDIYELFIIADIAPGWYIYSQTLESEEGPVPTSFGFEGLEGIEYLGFVEERGKKIEGVDPVFQMKLVKYAKHVEFVQILKIKPGVEEINGFVEFMTCNNEMCLPPVEVGFVVRP